MRICPFAKHTGLVRVKHSLRILDVGERLSFAQSSGIGSRTRDKDQAFSFCVNEPGAHGVRILGSLQKMSLKRLLGVAFTTGTLLGALSTVPAFAEAGEGAQAQDLVVASLTKSQSSVKTIPATSPFAGGTPRVKPPAPPISPLVTDEDYRGIEKAFDAIAKRRWTQARTLIAAVEDDVARDLLQWNLLTRKNTNASFEEVLSFAERRADWPRFSNVLRLAEKTLPKDMPADQTIAWFAGQEPLTGEGKIRLGEAYLALGQSEYGKVWIERAWVEHNFSGKREKKYCARTRQVYPRPHMMNVLRASCGSANTLPRAASCLMPASMPRPSQMPACASQPIPKAQPLKRESCPAGCARTPAFSSMKFI